MPKIYNTGLLKKWIIYMVFLHRCLLFALLFLMLGTGDLTGTEYRTLLFISFPCSAIFISFALRYTIYYKRYFVPGIVLNAVFFWTNLTPFILFASLELMGIYFKYRLFDHPETIITVIAVLESVLAGYAGIRLPSFFTFPEKNNAPGSDTINS